MMRHIALILAVTVAVAAAPLAAQDRAQSLADIRTELAALAAASGPAVLEAPGRAELETMMLAHPDRQAEKP